jgi:alkaline phosphatase/alkaline phosphatase D
MNTTSFPFLRFTSVAIFLALLACRPEQPAENHQTIFLAQGIMAGEVSAASAIVQARLTASDTVLHGDVPGSKGRGRFIYATSSDFADAKMTEWLQAQPNSDFILKAMLQQLSPGTQYYYRLEYGTDQEEDMHLSQTCTFNTLPGADRSDTVEFALVSCLNYYHFHFGNYDSADAYRGPDKALGYPGLVAIAERQPDFLVATGDNVYFDHPAAQGIARAKKAGKNPLPGLFDGQEVTTEEGMRRKYHLQFVQPRFVDLLCKVPVYWMKDDHDYRVNDADPSSDFPISHELGIKNFREQLPVVPPDVDSAKTYRTHKVSEDLQIWMVEGRDYRSPNDMPPGPDKSLWGAEQREWLQNSLLASDATFKILITPTPMIGPDDAYKKDNHTNPDGFRDEGEAFFLWLKEHNFHEKNFFIVCGDRHWQYHAVHPSGIEEFSTGTLVDQNARTGRLPGDPESTDPDGRITQYFVQDEPAEVTGGFLMISVVPLADEGARAEFVFYDDQGVELYKTIKQSSAN